MLVGEDGLKSDWGKEAGPWLEVKPKIISSLEL